MSVQIEQRNWAAVFEELSKRRYGWKTSIEVLSENLGDQTLVDALPLNGVTFEAKGNKFTIDIAVGARKNVYQNHRIENPSRIAVLQADDVHGDIIDIEQEDGTKTLIRFIEPMGLLVGFSEMIMVATV